eukprot:scaffold128866_cov69-Phaeocystis_antarctica.AAC.1
MVYDRGGYPGTLQAENLSFIASVAGASRRPEPLTSDCEGRGVVFKLRKRRYFTSVGGKERKKASAADAGRRPERNGE